MASFQFLKKDSSLINVLKTSLWVTKAFVIVWFMSWIWKSTTTHVLLTTFGHPVTFALISKDK